MPGLRRVAASTSSRHAENWAGADRPQGTVLNQVCLGLSVLHHQSLGGGPRMQAWGEELGNGLVTWRIYYVTDIESIAQFPSFSIMSSAEQRTMSTKCFNRSYAYTVWSAIGIIMSSVRLSVCPNAVHCASHGRCTGIKVAPACFYSKQACSYLSLQTLLLEYVSFGHKTHWKKRVEENANVSFWDRQSGMQCSCYVLLFTDFVNTLNGHATLE